MAGVGGDAPAPMKDDGPDPMTGITIVHKVKSKLGYTEIHTPAPPLDEKGHVSFDDTKPAMFMILKKILYVTYFSKYKEVIAPIITVTR